MGIEQIITEMEFYNSKRNSKVQWYPLQLQILTKMDHNKRIFVFDEVGAGKTIEAGLAIWKTCLKQDNAKILIITQGILIEQYKSEMHDKFGINFRNVNDTNNWGSSDPTSIFNNKPCKFIIANPSASNIAKCRLDEGWDLLIIDEAHNFMNKDSLRTINIREIKAKQVIMFTATPIRNRLEELQSLIDLSQEITGDNNKISLPTAQDFLEQYNEKSCWMRNFKAIIRNDYRQRKVDIWKYDYRNNQSGVDSVNKIKNNDYWNLGNIFLLWGADKTAMEQNTKGYLKDKYGLGSIDEILDIDRKANLLVNKAIDIKEKKLKAIIFCRRKATIKYLEYICNQKGFNTSILLGEQQEYERNEILKQAKNGDTDIFIIMDKIGEVGLNLPEYNYVINYELPFSPADLEQRLGRIDRLVSGGINGDKPIHSIYMVHEDDGKGERNYDNKLFYMNMYKFLPTIITQIPSRNVLFDPGMILNCIDKMQFEKQWQLQTMEEIKKVLITINDIKGFKKDVIYTNQEDLYKLATQWEVPYRVVLALWFEKDYIIEENEWTDIKEIIEFKKIQIDRDLKQIEENMKITKANKEKLNDIGNGIFYYEDNTLQVKRLKGEGFIEEVYSEVAKGVINPILEHFNTAEEVRKRKNMFQDRLSEMSGNIKGLHCNLKNCDVKESKAIMNRILENKYMQADLLKLYKDEMLSIIDMSVEELNALIMIIEEYSNYTLLGKAINKQYINCFYKMNYLEKQIKLIISHEDQMKYYLYGENNCIFRLLPKNNRDYAIKFVEYYYFRGLDTFGLVELYKNHRKEILLTSLDHESIFRDNLEGYLLFYGSENEKALPISKKNIELNEFDISYGSQNREVYLSVLNSYKCNKHYSVESIDRIILSPQIPGRGNRRRFDRGWKPVETLLDYVIDVTQDYNEKDLLTFLKDNKMEQITFYSKYYYYSTAKIIKLIYIKRLIRDIDIHKFEDLDEKTRHMIKIDKSESLDVVEQFERNLRNTLEGLNYEEQNEIVKLCNEGSYNWERCTILDNLEEDLIRKRFLFGGTTANIYDEKLEFKLNDISTFSCKKSSIYIEDKEIDFKVIRVGSCRICDRSKLSENLYAADAKALLGKEEFFKKNYKEIIKQEISERGNDILIYIVDKKEALLFINEEIKEYTNDNIQGEFLEKIENIGDGRDNGILSLKQLVFGWGVAYRDRKQYSTKKGVFLLKYICKLEENLKV